MRECCVVGVNTNYLTEGGLGDVFGFTYIADIAGSNTSCCNNIKRLSH